jgi:hypothetical protein
MCPSNPHGRSFMSDLYQYGTSCSRYYFLHWWYAKLIKAGGRLDPPFWTGPRGACVLTATVTTRSAGLSERTVSWDVVDAARGGTRLYVVHSFCSFRPAVPIWNETHDGIVRDNLKRLKESSKRRRRR